MSGSERSRDGLARVTFLPGADRVPGSHAFAADESADDDEGDVGVVVEFRSVAGASGNAGAGAYANDDADGDAGDVELTVDELRSEAEETLLRRLRGKSFSKSEAAEILRGVTDDPSIVDGVVERMVELGYLDDRKLADHIVYTHHDRKGLGRKAVETELRRRKIEAEVVVEVVDELPDDELERASELAVERMSRLGSLDDTAAERRLNGFLARRGYSSAVSRQAITAALASRRRPRSGVRFE
ncbi:regulatory protein RecX [Compostimonas suwonensis]|uniref:Regulatory protein RecX n=1 Tax=Compostimonas suwonensis TaxID=1048394 RepID=A0A2M9BTR8_9MICO|nr:regulatory protein RecX [Compostimonas suwonensis]PJJ61337.1 SOS response regulatory protein OraA/RecX [Compostimonas suwonensis]